MTRLTYFVNLLAIKYGNLSQQYSNIPKHSISENMFLVCLFVELVVCSLIAHIIEHLKGS